MKHTLLYVCLLAVGTVSGQDILTLRSALEQTEKLSPDLAMARLKVVEATATSKATQSAWQPQIQAGVQAAYQTNNLQGVGLVFPGFPSRIGPYRTFNARPQVTQSILDLSLLAEVRASRARQRQAELAVRSLRDDLAIVVVQIYLQALQAQSRQDAATVRIGTAEAILAQVQSKEELGTASKLDAARALQQLENERLVQIEAARDCHVLQTLLLKTIGKEQQGTVGIRLEKPEFVLLLENEVQRNARDLRSDLLAEEAKAKVADLERRAVGQQRFPKVTGFADYGLLGAGPDRSIGTYNIGISMTVPLWTGRRIESQVAAAQARTDQTEQQVKKIKLQIQQEIRQAAIELQSARESLQSATKATAAAKEILDLSLLRFESGLATSVDTQIAQSDWATNEDRRIQSEYALLLGQARLAKAGGVLSTASVK